MVTRQGLHSDLAIPPGEYLVEVIEELGITQAEVARRMGRPIQAINEIALGKKAITSETALQLEKVTGVPAHIWTGLENEYRLVLARNEDEERLRVDAAKVDPETFRAMSKLGWVPASRRANEKARELCRFFGVASLAYVKDAKLAGYAFRIANRDAASSLALAAWLRKAELDSHVVTAQPFNANRLRLTLAELRALTRMPPSKWLPAAKELLAASGVVLVVLPHLPKTYANGATFWLSAEKAVTVLSLRGTWADIFWFTLFHELGHVILHGRRTPHISLEKADDQIEVEANVFAADSLIPRREYEMFVLTGNFSEAAVASFSDSVGIAPGIVVGRLQHEGHVTYALLNSLREKYSFEGQ